MREPVAGGPGPEQHVEGLAEAGVGVTLVDVNGDGALDIVAGSASRTGLCHGRTSTPVPRRSVDVRVATQVCSISVAATWFQPLKWCSTRNDDSNPSASASTLSSTWSRIACVVSTSAVHSRPKRMAAESAVARPPRATD